MGSMPKISNILSGVAGEYFVAAELSRMGHIASITLHNTQGLDILASNEDASRQVGIQVKTNQNTKRAWMVNKKAEEYFAGNIFYIFVNLKEKDQRPDFYIVPSGVVAERVKIEHQAWLDTPGKQGQIHKDTTIRKFRDEEGEFLERWEVLGL